MGRGCHSGRVAADAVAVCAGLWVAGWGACGDRVDWGGAWGAVGDCRFGWFRVDVSQAALVFVAPDVVLREGAGVMLSLILACFWVVIAQAIALLPSRDHHWRAAYGLIAVGLPLLGYVIYENGPWLGALAAVAAMSILRWPVIYVTRWLRAKVGLDVPR